MNADVPPIDVHFLDYPDKEINELGARGIGEIGLAGIAAAITAAIYHATGVRVRELPVKIEDLPHLFGAGLARVKAWQQIIRRVAENPARSWALATLVETAGSTYRKPGARLLVDADGGYFGRFERRLSRGGTRPTGSQGHRPWLARLADVRYESFIRV